MDEHYATLTDMMALLLHDAVRSAEELHSHEAGEDGPFRARMHVRAVFSAIEGACECLRQQAFVAEVNKIPHEISPGKLSVLAGETYFVTDEGEIRVQNLRIRFLAHMLLSLNSYAEAQGVNYSAEKGDQWHRIRAALDVRHRITHPKNLTSLHITKDEIKDIHFALAWFLNELASILREKGCELPPFPQSELDL